MAEERMSERDAIASVEKLIEQHDPIFYFEHDTEIRRAIRALRDLGLLAAIPAHVDLRHRAQNCALLDKLLGEGEFVAEMDNCTVIFNPKDNRCANLQTKVALCATGTHAYAITSAIAEALNLYRCNAPTARRK
jgi:hypothetical protein